MQIDLARYDDMVHGIYDAALHQERWSEVLAGVAALLGATRAVLFTWVHSPAHGGFCFTHNIPPAALDFLAIKSMYEDPFVKAALARGLMVEGVAMRGVDLGASPYAGRSPPLSANPMGTLDRLPSREDSFVSVRTRWR